MRSQLATTVSSAAGPYGYTISLGGSIAVAQSALGRPHILGALLLMLGAVAGFVLLEFAAQGSLRPQVSTPDRPPSILGNAHIPSAGLALLSVWGIDQLVDGYMGWVLTGFLATSVYFLASTCQRLLVSRWHDGES